MNKTLHHRACNLCEAICGLTIETVQEPGAAPRISSIRFPGQLQSRSHLSRAVALQDIQNDPERLRAPHKRVGGSWQVIGWDEAFVLAAQKLWVVQQASWLWPGPGRRTYGSCLQSAWRQCQ